MDGRWIISLCRERVALPEGGRALWQDAKRFSTGSVLLPGQDAEKDRDGNDEQPPLSMGRAVSLMQIGDGGIGR